MAKFVNIIENEFKEVSNGIIDIWAELHTLDALVSRVELSARKNHHKRWQKQKKEKRPWLKN